MGAANGSEYFALRDLELEKHVRQNKRLIIVWRGAPLKAQIPSSAPPNRQISTGNLSVLFFIKELHLFDCYAIINRK